MVALIRNKPPTVKPEGQLITRQELADLLKISIRSVDSELKKGLPCYRIGKAVRFDYNLVLAYYQEKK